MFLKHSNSKYEYNSYIITETYMSPGRHATLILMQTEVWANSRKTPAGIDLFTCRAPISCGHQDDVMVYTLSVLLALCEGNPGASNASKDLVISLLSAKQATEQ